MYWLGEPFLYLSVAFVVGWLVMVGAKESEALARIPMPLIIAALLGITVFAFLPVLRIIMFFADDLGFGLIFESVMFSFTEGKAYWLTVLFISLLILTIGFGKPVQNQKSWILCCVLMFGLIVSLGWSSHLTALYGNAGLITYVLHFLAVAVWSGTLLVVGWFKPLNSWDRFLSWFHPTAMLAMLVIILSGIYLTNAVAPEYLNSLALPYGQALLIKHLLIIPLMVFAFMNSFLVKRKLMKNPSFNPRPWAKAESILILMIYTVTGFMNQQSAPHDVSETLRVTPASKLFVWFHQGYENTELKLRLDPMVFIYIVIASGCIVAIFYLFQKNKNSYLAVSLSVLLVLTLYIIVMTTVA